MGLWGDGVLSVDTFNYTLRRRRRRVGRESSSFFFVFLSPLVLVSLLFRSSDALGAKKI